MKTNLDEKCNCGYDYELCDYCKSKIKEEEKQDEKM